MENQNTNYFHVLGNTPRKSKFNPDLARQLNEEAEREERAEELRKKLEEKRGKGKAKPESPEAETPQGNLEVKTSQDYWTIQSINYRNQLVSVDLLKTLLDNGSAKTQDDWIEYSKQAKTRNDFYTGDYRLHHALFRALFLSRDSANRQQAEEARAFLEKQFHDRWLMTSTRIKYMPKAKDIIIHDYGMQDKLELQESFVGDDEMTHDRPTSLRSAVSLAYSYGKALSNQSTTEAEGYHDVSLPTHARNDEI